MSHWLGKPAVLLWFILQFRAKLGTWSPGTTNRKILFHSPHGIPGISNRNFWSNGKRPGCFFRALPDKSLAEEGRRCKGGKKSKLRTTVAFFVNAKGEKEKPIVIRKIKNPRCFKNLRDKRRPANVTYFSNPKSWMNSEIIIELLEGINRRMRREQREIILFLDNAGCHPVSLQEMFSNIKVVFLPPNTTSRLQPLDTGMIKNFKVR